MLKSLILQDVSSDLKQETRVSNHEKFSGRHEKRCFVTIANRRYLQGSKSGTLVPP
jgi:hypothetical protein